MNVSSRKHQIVTEILESQMTVHALPAGAGVGKTEFLKHLIEEQVKRNTASKILFVSFTKNAVIKASSRIGLTAHVIYKTCHSIGYEILKTNPNRLIKKKDIGFLWYEEDVHWQGMAEVLDEGGSLKLLMELAKKDGIEASFAQKAQTFLEKCYASQKRLEPHLGNDEAIAVKTLLKDYAREKRKRGLIDFHDMIVFAHALIIRHSDPRLPYFHLICSDESQDNNDLQLKILQALKKEETKFVVVGDACQLAYVFMGARSDFFRRVRELFTSDVAVYSQSVSFRCPDTICRLSNDITSKIDFSDKSPIVAQKGNGGVPVKIVLHRSDKDGIQFIMDKIKSLIGKEYDYRDVVILVRNAKGDTATKRFADLKKQLDKSGIPFTYRDELADDLVKYEQFLCAIKVAMEEEPAPTLVDTFCVLIGYSRKQKSQSELIADLRVIGRSKPMKEIVLEAADVCRAYKGPIHSKIVKFFLTFNAYEELEGWYGRLEQHFKDKNKVTISTIHAFKGDERKVVFILGAEEGMLPYKNKSQTITDAYLMEEMCLMNIAVTRSSDRLFILSTRSVFRGESNLSSFLVPLLGRDYIKKVLI